MRSVLGAPFPLLESLRFLDRLMTFEEILASTVDEEEDYQRFRYDSPKNTLSPLDMGLVLVGQPIGILHDLTIELDQATQLDHMEVEQSGRHNAVESGEVPRMDEEVNPENASARVEL